MVASKRTNDGNAVRGMGHNEDGTNPEKPNVYLTEYLTKLLCKIRVSAYLRKRLSELRSQIIQSIIHISDWFFLTED